MKFLLRGPSAWSVYLTHLCVVLLSVYIVWNFGRLFVNSYHVVTIIGILVSRLRSRFLLGVTGPRAVLVDLAVVGLHVGPVGARGQLLEEELIVGPELPLLDHLLEVLPEGPVVCGPLGVLLHGRLGGVRLWLPPDVVPLWITHYSVMASLFNIINGESLCQT